MSEKRNVAKQLLLRLKEEDLKNLENIKVSMSNSNTNEVIRSLISNEAKRVDTLESTKLRKELNKLKKKCININTDKFFNEEEIRIKYNDFDIVNCIIPYELSNAELESMLDNEDLKELIKFYEDYISELEEDNNV
jgi:hypothetical protein